MKRLYCPGRNVFGELKLRFDVHSYQPAHAQTHTSHTTEITSLLPSIKISFGAATSHSLHKFNPSPPTR